MGIRNRKSREKELEGVNLLGLAPHRIAGWDEVDGRAVLIRPAPETRGIRGFMDRFFHRMSAQRVRLDELGSFAWNLFDGKRTVAEVGEAMRERYGEEVEPVEERLGRLVWLMRREGFLGYRDWDD
ncbi:MAG: PqqD family protein [Gemmatimonadota bacterium]|jgi:hypothetical protein